MHCYAETVAARFSKPGQAYEGLVDDHGRWNGKIAVIDKHLLDPIRWQRPRKIFVNSMSDLFHENLETEWIDYIFAVMSLAQRHTFQVLTKRPERMRDYTRDPDVRGRVEVLARRIHLNTCRRCQKADAIGAPRPHLNRVVMPWPLPNVWLGTSVENQETTWRLDLLREVLTVVPWVSLEPLLGPVDLFPWLDFLRWVVPGGESGADHRPMEIWWAECTATQCQALGVAVFVKQDSGPRAGEQRRLSDVMWALKEFPKVADPPPAAEPVLDLMAALKKSLGSAPAT